MGFRTAAPVGTIAYMAPGAYAGAGQRSIDRDCRLEGANLWLLLLAGFVQVPGRVTVYLAF